MPKVTKMNSGLMFYDDFKEKSLVWTLSPSDVKCLSFGEKGLRMLHQKRYCYYTMQEPAAEEYSCIVELDHIPFNEDDIAGILVLASNKEYAECQTYIAKDPSEITNTYTVEQYVKVLMKDMVVWSENENEPESNPYAEDEPKDYPTDYHDVIFRYIKIHKFNNRYYFFASPDSYYWIPVGNVGFRFGAQLGFFNYGVRDKKLCNNTENSHCYFIDYAIYQSQYLFINGIERIYDFEIIDGTGRVLLRSDNTSDGFVINRSSKEAVINTTLLPMPFLNSHIRVFPKDNYTVTTFEAPLGEKVYGGDRFIVNKDIRLYIDGQEIDDTQMHDLGTFDHGNNYIKVDVKNCDTYMMANLVVSVQQYSEYYSGDKPLYIALFQDGQQAEDLQYTKSVIIDKLQPSETKSFFMRLIDIPSQGFYDVANSYRFKITVE